MAESRTGPERRGEDRRMGGKCPVTIGVLGYQGGVEPHVRMVERCGARAVIVRDRASLDAAAALILPGGESTTLGRLLRRFGLDGPVLERIANGMPVFGTCAGLILMARRVIGGDPSPLACLDVTVERNAFGRQTESFVAGVRLGGFADPVRGVFIRAPYIKEAGPGVEVWGTYEGRIVAARQGHLWGTAFHPELTDDTRVHRSFIAYVEERL